MERYMAEHQDRRAVALDIGANIGSHTIRLAKYFRFVYAFEPQPRVFWQLSQNVRLNHVTNAALYNIALSDTHSLAELSENATNQGNVAITQRVPADGRRSFAAGNLVETWPLDDVLARSNEGYRWRL